MPAPRRAKTRAELSSRRHDRLFGRRCFHGAFTVIGFWFTVTFSSLFWCGLRPTPDYPMGDLQDFTGLLFIFGMYLSTAHEEVIVTVVVGFSRTE